MPEAEIRFARIALPATAAHDHSLPQVELDGHRFHLRSFGDEAAPPVLAVHGGPGGDLHYLLPLQPLAERWRLVLYDQRGTGLSPRVPQEQLTLPASLDDLHRMVLHVGRGRPLRLIGHSWGAMLVLAYLGRHPDLVSHAVAVEPGMLNADTAAEFVRRLKVTQRLADLLPMIGYLLQTPFVATRDGHERNDHVMTRLLNRSKPGGPYQCAGQVMPPDAFARAGYAAFNAMLRPVLGDPSRFRWNLTEGLQHYRGRLLMLSSECSFIGHRYQQQFHLPLLPPHTRHLLASGMGHNMLTLNAPWSVQQLHAFFEDRPLP